MICCADWITDDDKYDHDCPDCGGPVNKEGQCIESRCEYSSILCETCDNQPCDQSC
jgi:hypothetical protein